jgi:hypothetical protein
MLTTISQPLTSTLTEEEPMTAQPSIPHPRNSPGVEMLTLHEAADLLRLPENTLRYWRHLGSGPTSFKVGRHVRYWRTDVMLWLAEQSDHPQHH